MARRDNAYSRLVAWLKLLLPLAALAILSTLFLVARTIDPSRAIPNAPVDVETLARDPRIGAPDYTGVTADGTAIRVVAETAWPDLADQGRMSARIVSGVLETPGGGRYEMSALEGFIDGEAGQVRLTGDVILTAPAGYELRSETVIAALDRTRLEGTGATRASGPPGTITSNGFVMRPATVGERDYVLVFLGGVKLIYDPKPED